jgi:hypothetical protein
MASSLSGGAGNDLVIPDDAAVQITSPEANEGIALVEFESQVSDINLAVGGDAPMKLPSKPPKLRASPSLMKVKVLWISKWHQALSSQVPSI